MIGCAPEAGLDFFIGAMRFARLWGTADVYHPFYAPRGICSGANPVISSTPRSTDWSKAKCILLVESDLATTHPVAFGRLLEARDKGAEIIALDSRFTPTMSKADVAHWIRPDSGNRFALALMKAMLEEDPHPLKPVEVKFDQFDAWKGSFQSLAYDDLAKITGLPAAKVVEIARRLAAKKPVTVITGNRLSGRQNSGIWPTMVLARGWNLLEGGGWYPLDAGLPPLLPFTDIDEQELGRNAPEDDRVGKDKENPVKALISSGNCLYDFMSSMRGIAKGTELNIHFGAFPNETVNLSHFVIPATLWPEREALSFTNDRAIRWAERIVEPASDLRSGLDFWTGLAQRLADVRHLEGKACFPWKKDDGSSDPRSFYGWLLEQSPLTSGCGIDRIIANDGNESVHWPIDPAASAITPDTLVAFSAPSDLQPLFQAEQRELFPLDHQATPIISRSGPLSLELEDADAVQIHPDTAAALGIETGDQVTVYGPGETFEAWALLTRMVPRWLIWSARRLATNCALVCKKGQPCEEASRILGEFLR
jgi:anaerobic selenocysteine-containing dehydrogenase